MLLVTLIISTIWGIADRERKNYDKAFYWVWVAIRYALAYYMVVYGCSKIFVMQFPALSLHRLVQPYGMSSPMGLAWSFMGASPGFTIFTGAMETLGGILLLFRPTVKAGALLSTVVLTVIVAMNFCYDIPVKIFSSHLLMSALYVLSPDFARLLVFIFTNKSVPQQQMYLQNFNGTTARIAWTATKTVIVLALLVYFINMEYSNRSWYTEMQDNVPLSGLYQAELVVHNNDTIPPDFTDSTRWRYFIVQYRGRATVRYMNDSFTYFSMSIDTIRKGITMTDPHKNDIYIHYKEDGDKLLLSRHIENDTTHIYLTRKDPNEFLLNNRGFHWVNEVPYNK